MSFLCQCYLTLCPAGCDPMYMHNPPKHIAISPICLQILRGFCPKGLSPFPPNPKIFLFFKNRWKIRPLEVPSRTFPIRSHVCCDGACETGIIGGRKVFAFVGLDLQNTTYSGPETSVCQFDIYNLLPVLFLQTLTPAVSLTKSPCFAAIASQR